MLGLKRCILKLVNRGVIDNVNNIIRVGKEACVCSAYGYGMSIEAGGRGEHGQIDGVPLAEKQYLAVKFFFTTLSDFKNRSEYVDGDPRYHNSHFSDQKYSASLKIWAEKEFRNYRRIKKKQAFCAQLHIVLLIQCL